MGIPQIVWLVILTLANVIFLALKIIERRNGKNPNNPHSPGEAIICRENRDILIKLREKVANLEGDVSKIWEKIDK